MKDAITPSRLTELETVIQRGQQTFVEVGMALVEIRDTRLYRQDFATFEDYCKERWGWSADRSRKLIRSAEAVAQMSETRPWSRLSIPITNERQARELSKIKDPEIRSQVWQQANEIAAEVETAVTAKIVQQAVKVQEQIKQEKSVKIDVELNDIDPWAPKPFERKEASRLVGVVAFEATCFANKYNQFAVELKQLIEAATTAQNYIEGR